MLLHSLSYLTLISSPSCFCLSTSHTLVPLCSASSRSRYFIFQHLAGLVLYSTTQSWLFIAYSCASSPLSPLQRGSPPHPLLHSLVCRLLSFLSSFLIPTSTKFPDFLSTNNSSPYLILIPTTFELSSVFPCFAVMSIREGGYCSHWALETPSEAEGGAAVPEGKACLALQCNSRRCLEPQKE